VELAIEGKYHARNYTDLDVDLAILIYELGGGAALHALNHSPIQLPSRHTIADVRRQHRLRITVGDVKMSDILENIEILFKNDIDVGEFTHVGHTLSQDEIASDARLCYLPETDEIGGLCEHAITELDTFKMGSDLTSVRATAKAVREGRVHVGKEFSVAAFSRHAETDYGAKPVLLLPTCKQGSWQSSAQLLQKLVKAWKLSPFGEAMHGPLWSIASDGDATRRAALYLICMHRELEKDDPLYDLLYDLKGLNLHCGEGGLTMDFDYKHLFKRTSSLFHV
jgi:predicted RecA/RadA family phage recombinase